MPQTETRHARSSCTRTWVGLASILRGWGSLRRRERRAQRRSTRHFGAHGLWRDRIDIGRQDVACSAGFDRRRPAYGGGLDSEGIEMKRSRQLAKADGPSSSVDLVALADYVERFSTKTVVLLGDFVADEFQYGEISRVSREAPVLILRHRESHLVPGGGANAANNLASLGARVLPITAVGDDAAGDALIAHFRRLRVNVSGILRVRGWTTPTKSRFLAGWAHTVGQQVLRVDYEPKSPPPDAIRKKLHQRLAAGLRKAHALAVSDYGFGVATPELVQQASSGRRNELPVTLDARYHLHRYAKAGITRSEERRVGKEWRCSWTPSAGQIKRHMS